MEQLLPGNIYIATVHVILRAEAIRTTKSSSAPWIAERASSKAVLTASQAIDDAEVVCLLRVTYTI